MVIRADGSIFLPPRFSKALLYPPQGHQKFASTSSMADVTMLTVNVCMASIATIFRKGYVTARDASFSTCELLSPMVMPVKLLPTQMPPDRRETPEGHP